MAGRRCGWVGRGVGAALLAALAACAGAPPAGPEPGVQAALPPPPAPTRTEGAARVTRDFDGNGLISASEAAGYYARRFGELDQNGDGWLSRAELAGEVDAAAGTELRFGDLDLDADAKVSSDEYFESGARRFQQRIDPSTGMMSTSDFDSMVRHADPPAMDEVPPALECHLAEGPAAPSRHQHVVLRTAAPACSYLHDSARYPCGSARPARP